MTREREEADCLNTIRRNKGYFTIFWATENQRRACAMTRLEQSGRIINDTNDLGLGFPLCHAIIKDDSNA